MHHPLGRGPRVLRTATGQQDARVLQRGTITREILGRRVPSLQFRVLSMQLTLALARAGRA
jgi:hypothetical protein